MNLKTRRIVLLAAPESQILDITGPFQIFIRASEILLRQYPDRPPAYVVELVSTSHEKMISTSCGLSIVAGRSYRSVKEPVDTLLVAGGSLMEEGPADPALVSWLHRICGAARRFGSICTGAFLLAKAGLLTGKRVATHWKYCEELARNYPEITVDPEPIFIRDGKVYTSAGVTAGMDLALALVEEDFDSRLALEVARELVLYLRRPGGQSQFSAALSLQVADRHPLKQLHSWILEHLREDLSVEILASRAGMSPRNFARVFAKEIGTTPARYVERLRLERACQRLEETDRSLDEIATDCGFGGSESMRRVFHRILVVSPGEYRLRFKRKPAATAKQPKSHRRAANGIIRRIHA